MKKSLFVAIVFLLTLATLIPVYADIPPDGWTWLGTTYTGDDEYHKDYVNAYESGTTAVLAVKVDGEEGHNITITSVYVNMDWDDTYESTQVSATNTETLDDVDTCVLH